MARRQWYDAWLYAPSQPSPIACWDVNLIVLRYVGPYLRLFQQCAHIEPGVIPPAPDSVATLGDCHKEV